MKTPTASLNNVNRWASATVHSRRSALFSLALLAACGQVWAAELDWKNTAGNTDFNAAASYTQGTAPIAASVEFFKTTAVAQPSLTATLTTAGLNFSASGYDFTDAAAANKLTLTGYGTSGTGSTASTAAAIYTSATGTNTIEVPITLAPSNGTGPSTIIAAGVGGNLILSGKLSGTLGFSTTISGGSTLTLSGASDISGTITLSTATLTGGAATLAIGNDSALGTAAVTFSSGNTLAAVGGAHTITNNILYSGSGGVAGSNDLTLGGTFTSSGSSTRTFTVTNSGVTTLSGSVYLAPDNTTARGLIINGTGATTISGAIANNASGNTLASFLQYSGNNTLALTGNNSYTGTTSITNGTIRAASATGAALGTTSALNISNGGTLLLGNSNQVKSSANVTLGAASATGGTINTAGYNQTLGALTLTSSSTIDFGSGRTTPTSALSFADSSAATWVSSTTLTIADYSGSVYDNNVSAVSGTGGDTLFFGSSASGLTSIELAQIRFVNPSGYTGTFGAYIDGTGEVFADVPEPATLLGGALLVGIMGSRLRELAKLKRARRVS